MANQSYYKPSYTPMNDNYGFPNPFAQRGPADYMGAAGNMLMGFGGMVAENQKNIRETNVALQENARKSANDSFNNFMTALKTTAELEQQRQQSKMASLQLANLKLDYDLKQLVVQEQMATKVADSALDPLVSQFESAATFQSSLGDAVMMYDAAIKSEFWGKAKNTQLRFSDTIGKLNEAPRMYRDGVTRTFEQVAELIRAPLSTPGKFEVVTDLVTSAVDKTKIMNAAGYTSAEDQALIMSEASRRPAVLENHEAYAMQLQQIKQLPFEEFQRAKSELDASFGVERSTYNNDISAEIITRRYVPSIQAAFAKTPGSPVSAAAEKYKMLVVARDALKEAVKNGEASVEDLQSNVLQTAAALTEMNALLVQAGRPDLVLSSSRGAFGANTVQEIRKAGDWKGGGATIPAMVDYLKSDHKGLGNTGSDTGIAEIWQRFKADRITNPGLMRRFGRSIQSAFDELPGPGSSSQDWYTLRDQYSKAGSSLKTLLARGDYMSKELAFNRLREATVGLKDSLDSEVEASMFETQDILPTGVRPTQTTMSAAEALLQYAREGRTYSQYLAAAGGGMGLPSDGGYGSFSNMAGGTPEQKGTQMNPVTIPVGTAPADLYKFAQSGQWVQVGDQTFKLK